MPPSKRRGSRVLYVASSARDLPDEVQDWLSQAGHPATACPNIYEALALLATGRQPAVLIVNVDTVDWDEMDFFDHAVRLGSGTEILVTGREHGQEKMEAACTRGARVFDPDTAKVEIGSAPGGPGMAAGSGGLLAGSLRWHGQTAPVEQADQQEPEGQDAADREQIDEPPQVRLVTPIESEDEEIQEQETTFPLPVPWVENPHRPRRTPPAPVAQAGKEASTASGRGASQGGEAQHPSPVELTPEELAALLGKPGAKSGPAKERRR